MTKCVCPKAGWCERHKVDKPSTLWHLCQTRVDYFEAWERGEGPLQKLVVKKQRKRAGLGDMVAGALKAVGITEQKVKKWLGHPCGCAERQEKLNRLGDWALGVVTGRTDKQDLQRLLDKPDTSGCGKKG